MRIECHLRLLRASVGAAGIWVHPVHRLLMAGFGRLSPGRFTLDSNCGFRGCYRGGTAGARCMWLWAGWLSGGALAELALLGDLLPCRGGQKRGAGEPACFSGVVDGGEKPAIQ